MPNFPLDTGSVSDNYCTQSPATKQWLTQPLSKWSNLLDPKLLEDGGEPPKSQGRGRWFDSRLWHLLSTWHKSRQVVNCLLCFGFGMSTFCSKKRKKKELTYQTWLRRFVHDEVTDGGAATAPTTIMRRRRRWKLGESDSVSSRQATACLHAI